MAAPTIEVDCAETVNIPGTFQGPNWISPGTIEVTDHHTPAKKYYDSAMNGNITSVVGGELVTMGTVNYRTGLFTFTKPADCTASIDLAFRKLTY